MREARALAKLRHPNILSVFAVGEGEGLTYMITPRIEGASLRDVIDRDGRLAPRDAARIASEIARALDAAHRLGIIHRDVRPEAIFLEGSERQALLTDFGIAKSNDGDAKLTAAGVLLGNPRYMSPEQVEGKRDIDGRADVFALGVVLFEMLTGRMAFDAPTMPKLVVQRLKVDPPPIRKVEPSVSTSLAAIVSRCLARDRANRWDSAADLAVALTVEATRT
jgi:eukaryotic-like serine/threonine-protein kinase